MTYKFIVEGRRWRDKINGNTYHSVTVTDAETQQEVFNEPFEYGYGDQWIYTAIDGLIKKGLWKADDRTNHELKRQLIYFNCADVQRKKDL